ncbi:response regulator [Coleofasciculus sp. LEGE 07081]|uniref:response regulator n=1 Tax=unclassified Coleofasciculus TaxID=2692782 RepID=UPI00187DF5BC|nr:response regulator [Coleofasciculus sp. LEGE 07081]MBE9151520.1 response regulator [Coleofasciculus sp. LEGE 07092]
MRSHEMSKPKLLVVDDEPDNLDLLYRTFHRDYKVLRADNGPAALEVLAQEGDIAVIISDQRMPLMSGTEFLSITAAQYPDIIRIILTGYTDVEDLVEAINAGKVFKYVTKPWNADELKSVVRQAMDTHNVLKSRTSELCQTLRRETLLNTVTNTIRNAQYDQSDRSPLQDILQRIVETVGHVLEVDVCILRPFQEGQLVDEGFVYQRSQSEHSGNGATPTFSQPTPNLFPAELTSRSIVTDSVSDASEAVTLTPLLTQTVWETREVSIINDVLSDERLTGDDAEAKQRFRAYQQANIRSTLIVPLVSQQELVAVMGLHQRSETHIWENDEIQLVVMVADQAALAISQARAYEQIHALATQQTLINTITTAIRSTLDPQEIFTAITQQLGVALKVDGCVLSLWSEEDEFVQCVGLYDGKSAQVWRTHIPDASLDEEAGIEGSPLYCEIEQASPNAPPTYLQLPQSKVPISGNPVLRQVVSTSSPVVLNDLAASPDMNGFDLPLRQPARALLVVPLLVDGKIIGSITLRQINKPRRWLPSEIDLAQAVASQAAIAVQQSRLYQKTRQQAERLLELDRQKTEFFQNVSHEFRTPLTLTIGPLESAVNQQQGLSYPQSEIALRNSRRLLRLVNQLLDLQRLDAGRMQSSFRPCDLIEFVSQIIEAFRPYCEKKEISLASQLIPCPPIYLDAEKFDKVLYNLLSNAMKFTNAKGRITIAIEPAGDHVRMRITDTGIGISKEQIPHLFERFRQAEGSLNRSYEGSGLGLALVKELVELHGGQISVNSIPGEGTTFTVWLQTGTAHLPLEQILEVPTEIQSSRAAVELADLEIESSLEDEEEQQNNGQIQEIVSQNSSLVQSLNSAGAHQSGILVVDDNTDLRSYVSLILRQAGYQVWTARNGQEGFEKTKTHHPHLIVTDLMMPGVSGLDLIRLIRESEELKGTPIVLLTAKADEASRIEGAEKGADAYLSKPFNDRELLAEVRNLLALKENEQRVVELNTYLTESVLRRFLPPAMVKKAARGELLLDLHPEPRLITTLFSDIVGFTELSNTLRSRRVAELLNEYLAAMTIAVFDNGGTVDKFMGDGILAIFGAPEELTPQEQARRAIAAARQMLQSLEVLNQQWLEKGIVGNGGPPPVRFRCGIHQGTAVVGMFGGKERSDYTAIGPSVNIAARLQEAAEPNSILVSASVADWLDDDAISKYRPLKLKGVDETVLTFAVQPLTVNST